MKRGILTCQIYSKTKGITDTLTEIDVETVTNMITMFEIVQSRGRRLDVQCVGELVIGINVVLTLVVLVVEILIICFEIFAIIVNT